jgi:hypothetical protein
MYRTCALPACPSAARRDSTVTSKPRARKRCTTSLPRPSPATTHGRRSLSAPYERGGALLKLILVACCGKGFDLRRGEFGKDRSLRAKWPVGDLVDDEKLGANDQRVKKRLRHPIVERRRARAKTCLLTESLGLALDASADSLEEAGDASSPSRVCHRTNGAACARRTRSNDSTRSSSAGSRRRPCCRRQTRLPCCFGHYLLPARSTCARSMAGKALPQRPSISRLTSGRPDRDADCAPQAGQAELGRSKDQREAGAALSGCTPVRSASTVQPFSITPGLDTRGQEETRRPGRRRARETQSWRELLLDLKRRGLSMTPQLAIANGAHGVCRANGIAYKSALRPPLKISGGGRLPSLRSGLLA